MKAKSIVLLVVALGCGLVAMLGVQQVMSSPAPEPEAQQKPADETEVLVATTKIEPFMALDDSNSAFQKMPKELVPDGAITSRADYADKKLRHGAFKGDVIVAEKLIDADYMPSTEIPSGMRVFTVKVNQTKVHSGLLRPGDHVDVVLTYRVSKPGRQPIQQTATVLQRVRVFAIDEIRTSTIQDADGNEIKAKNVSLLATPSDGNLLMLAENAGQLTLALRNQQDDKTDGEAKTFTTGDLASANRGDSAPKGDFRKYLQNGQNGQDQGEGGDQPEKSDDKAKGPPKWKLTIYNGTEKRVEEVDDPNAVVPEDKKRADDKDAKQRPKSGTDTGA